MSNFVYATPAPQVDPAVADKAPLEDAAIVEMARPVDAAIVEKAQSVDPALTYDDPMRYAPNNVRNPKQSEPAALSVEFLREESAVSGDVVSAFECYAAVLQGPPQKNIFRSCLPCVFDERDFVSYGEIRKYILVRGNRGSNQSCFVYGDKTDPAPLYGINLDDFDAFREDPEHPDPYSVTISPVPNTNKPRKEIITVLLRYKSNQAHAYQFTFDTSTDLTLADRFLHLFTKDNIPSNKFDQRDGDGSLISSDKISKKVQEFDSRQNKTSTTKQIS
jgi:hypothetical protein